jgi:hypothetical protein
MNVDTVKISGLVDFFIEVEVKAIEGKDRV